LRCASSARRLNLTLLALAFVISVFAGRLVQIQGIQSARYAAEAEQERMKQISIPAVRGSITASNGAVLAMTVQTDSVIADPLQIPARQRAEVAARLAGPLGKPAAAILSQLNLNSPRSQYALLATNVAETTANHIASLDLPGLTLMPTYSRSYPSGDLAANVVGFTNTDQQGNLVGEAGLEYQYDSLLAGRPGTEEVEVGTDGEPIPLTVAKLTQVVPGTSLRLTITPTSSSRPSRSARRALLPTTLATARSS